MATIISLIIIIFGIIALILFAFTFFNILARAYDPRVAVLPVAIFLVLFLLSLINGLYQLSQIDYTNPSVSPVPTSPSSSGSSSTRNQNLY